ncbi:MAG: 16S rRNA (adenine(1518)-N(6)/adenine(1519)-N(6))-dimethyltransferase RsmA [Actinobacteria bacterium]|nr:16S rRNA (adenine(1518)-N(6)/adenine(1519)-N(6))-dimethyltransferase RsmA [Actinomycetota bacterium]
MNSYLSSPSKTVEILSKHNIKLKKGLGQNFLIDTNILKKIIKSANLKPDDIVLEIGSGIGSLTELMLPEVKKVICIEIDSRLARVFKDIFNKDPGDNLKLIEGDALRIDYRAICNKYKITKVVSNLPYKIAAPLILKILFEAPKIKTLYLTVQKDIAGRLIAAVGGKNYNAYTLKSNFLADFKILFPISRNCFVPKPFVDSVVVEVKREDTLNEMLRTIKHSKKTTGKTEKLSNKVINDFFNFVERCFLHKRKKLINSLFEGTTRDIDKMNLIVKMLSDIGKGRDVRAEELTLENFLYLYKNYDTK